MDTGVRRLHFKDLIFEAVGNNPPFKFWEQHGVPNGTWVVEATTNPSSDMESLGNRYKCSGNTAGTISILKSKHANTWAEDDQTPTSTRNGVMYLVRMMVAAGGEAHFLFMWDTTNNTAYGIKLNGTTAILERCTGDPSDPQNWTELHDICNVSADTYYWFWIRYYPEEISINGNALGVEGEIEVKVDTARLKRGMGVVGSYKYVDPSPLVAGDKLGIGHNGGTNPSYFQCITFADTFLPSCDGFLVHQRLFLKGNSTMKAKFGYNSEVPPSLVINKRVELWVNNIGTDGAYYRNLEFTGVIRRKTIRQRERIVLIECMSEEGEFGQAGSRQECVQGTTLANYIKLTLTTESNHVFAKNSRIGSTYIDATISGLGSVSWSSTFTIDGTDRLLFKIMSYLASTIFTFCPEGFLLANNVGIPTGSPNFTFDRDDSTNAQPIIWSFVEDDLFSYANSVRVYNSGTLQTADNTSLQDTDSKSEMAFYQDDIPTTEALTIANSILAQMEDKNPFVELVTLMYKGDLFPGCAVFYNSSKDGCTDVEMIVVEKFVCSGDWSKEINWDYPSSAYYFRLAYFDHSGGRLPRVFYSDSDEMMAREVNKTRDEAPNAW